MPQISSLHVQRFFKDKQGKIVIVQRPNIWLSIYIVCVVVGIVWPSFVAAYDLLVVAQVGLLVWALLEIFQGVNYFRRLLGLVFAVGIVPSLIMRLGHLFH